MHQIRGFHKFMELLKASFSFFIILVLTNDFITTMIISNLILDNTMKERSSNFVPVPRKPGVDVTWHTQHCELHSGGS